MGFGFARAGHDKNILPRSTAMGTAGMLWGWPLPGHSAFGHCQDIQRLGTAEVRGGWAVQG